MHRSCVFILTLLLGAAGVALAHDEPVAQRPVVEKLASILAAELALFCPPAPPNDQAAFNTCRHGLFEDSAFRRSLAPIVLWGRPNPAATIKETNLTQFAPDALSGMYVSLFMFNGKYTVDFDGKEGLYRVAFETAFRNRLAPGQFPYPFWHNDNKWSMYQGANSITLFIEPKSMKVRVGQFTDKAANAPVIALQPFTPPKFDGKWIWTDENGVSQPVATLFDGLFKRDNPNLAPLDAAYKKLALNLRDGQCESCHVPNNPDHMKKLVLLQSPAHAAAEIKRLLKAVRDNTMPLDEFGIEKELPQHTKKELLDSALSFDAVLDAARLWEKLSGPATGAGQKQ